MLLVAAAGCATAVALAASSQFVQAPVPASRNTTLVGLSCGSVSSCVAVGSRSSSRAGIPAIYRWDGHSWARASAPRTSGVLEGVSCTPTGSCLAVGTRSSGSSNRLFAERGSPRAWLTLATPSLPGFDNEFDDVSCSSRASCVAVGGTQVQTPAEKALVERWNGRRWTASSAPRGVVLRSVSCASQGPCWAVGATEGTGARRSVVRPVIVQVRGKVARTVRSPLRGGNLSSISCPAATRCWATGNGAQGAAVVVELRKGAWHRLPAPSLLPTGEAGGISCLSTGQCTAVGDQPASRSASPADLTPWAATWNGVSWTFAAVPHLQGVFTRVACAGATACMAVGALNNGAAALAAVERSG